MHPHYFLKFNGYEVCDSQWMSLEFLKDYAHLLSLYETQYQVVIIFLPVVTHKSIHNPLS